MINSNKLWNHNCIFYSIKRSYHGYKRTIYSKLYFEKFVDIIIYITDNFSGILRNLSLCLLN